ncbi:MAG TPA: helix-turn-helix domain-containing protein [Casimicrobiaceae bacterium]|nr:helix-turn-helix domain-containing protein [Casimicrobiaceae bacterium]
MRGKRGPVRPDSRNVVRGRETHQRIIDAARVRIMRDGFEAMRLDDVARDAGVSKAAVIKSAGGKASILLAIGEEDRQTRLAAIEAAFERRSALRRRLQDVVRELFTLDAPRLNIVMAYIGHMWFWSHEDHATAQSMLDETRARLRALIAVASPERITPERLERIAMRSMSGYGAGIRDLYYGRSTLDEAVRFVVEFALD